MNNGRTVFSQLIEYLPTYEFRKCMRRYRGASNSNVLLVGPVPLDGLWAVILSPYLHHSASEFYANDFLLPRRIPKDAAQRGQ